MKIPFGIGFLSLIWFSHPVRVRLRMFDVILIQKLDDEFGCFFPMLFFFLDWKKYLPNLPSIFCCNFVVCNSTHEISPINTVPSIVLLVQLIEAVVSVSGESPAAFKESIPKLVGFTTKLNLLRWDPLFFGSHITRCCRLRRAASSFAWPVFRDSAWIRYFYLWLCSFALEAYSYILFGFGKDVAG